MREEAAAVSWCERAVRCSEGVLPERTCRQITCLRCARSYRVDFVLRVIVDCGRDAATGVDGLAESSQAGGRHQRARLNGEFHRTDSAASYTCDQRAPRRGDRSFLEPFV